MTDKLTLNLGVRYDLLWNMFQNQEEFLPFMESGRPQNTTNIQPRLGFTYQWDTQTVVRGGMANHGEMVQTTYPSEAKTVAVVEVLNDGRPDFAANPFNGPAPTYEQALQRYCAAPEQAANFAAWRARGFTGNAPCLLRGNGELKQRRLTTSTVAGRAQSASNGRWARSAVEVDYIFTKSRDEGWQQQNSTFVSTLQPASTIRFPIAPPAVPGIRRRGDDGAERPVHVPCLADSLSPNE